MKIVIISNCSIIREGISAILSRQEGIAVQFVGEKIKEAMLMIRGEMADTVVLDINDGNQEELQQVYELKNSGIKVRFIILDFYGNKELFLKALKYGVQGYILGRSSEEEIRYAIEQVHRDKKYFDSYFIDFMVKEDSIMPGRLELLTSREKEILVEVSRGLSNRKIADKLLITEHTVKKHVNHIFEKLCIKDRTEAALYVSRSDAAEK